jgi:biotin carboxyl carrier protein
MSEVVRIGDGVYRVVANDRAEIVYVASEASGTWSFANGRTFFEPAPAAPSRSRRARADVVQPLAAPMPATVIKVLVEPGSVVRKGDTVVVLEAMKMELPLRATADAAVTAVHCREGQLVQPQAVLVEFTSRGEGSP